VAKAHSAWPLAAAAAIVLLLHGSTGQTELKADDSGHLRAEGGAAADRIEVRAARIGDTKAVRVLANLALSVDPGIVWAVLIDYENMPRFVPDIIATRVVEVAAGKMRVAIEGTARFLVVDFPIETTIDVTYGPDRAIAIASVAGNLAIDATVRVQADGPHTRVHYQARITPDFWLPPLIGDFLIGRQIRLQFEGMVAEMHRRAARPQNVVQCRKPRCPMQFDVVG
jgi:carbon monoxide dehydrogenase subunit G